MPRSTSKSSVEQLGFDLAAPGPVESPQVRPPQVSLRAGPAPISKSALSTAPEVFSVKEITTRIRRALENALGLVWVRGEISNHRRQAAGHHYFTLKDESCQLACVLFAGDARSLKSLALRDGLEVQVRGEISVYEARGQVQMVVRLIQEVGLGALQARFEALKEKLAAAGLFSAERKRPLPVFPRRIGLITSPTGAALRDFLHVLWRRSPGTEVLLYPVRVQGQGAAAEMVAAVEALNDFAREGGTLDVLVLTRGGGSLEDLWEFNEEILARAIAGSALPLVSAVGHEIDFTISDFVADFRAPTPSAAAEILSADTAALREKLLTQFRRLRRAATGQRDVLHLNLRRLAGHRAWQEPSRRLREHWLKFDQAAQTLRELPATRWRENQQALSRARDLLRARHPARALAEMARRLDSLRPRLRQAPQRAWQEARTRQQSLAQLLRAFDPQNTLQRGYVLVRTPDGKILTTAVRARQHPSIELVFADGILPARPTPQ